MGIGPGMYLYLQPNVGSEAGGNGLIAGVDEDGLAVHVFHSKARARALLERYRRGTEEGCIDASLQRVDQALLPETSERADAVLTGFIAGFLLIAFRTNGEAGRDRLVMLDKTPRVILCFLDPDERQGLCAWRSTSDWQVELFFSAADACRLAEADLVGVVPEATRRKLKETIVAARLPSASSEAAVRIDGHAAAVICHMLEAEERRQAGN